MAVTELDTSGLNAQRNHKASKENEIFLARERKSKYVEEFSRLKRYINPKNINQNEQIQKLQRQIKAEETNIATKTGELSEIAAVLDREWKTFIDFTDPKAHLNRLDEKYPILLMPLRIETRFKKIPNDNGRMTDYLWVRIYPDDCFVDTYEETLSESEIRDVQTFWVNWWAAAGNDARRRAAWRYLVDGHGHGRAQHIINNYIPVNYDEVYHDGEENESPPVYLVINGLPDIQNEEKPALTEYWSTVYLATINQESAKIQTANENIASALGGERAAYLVQEYPPKNLNQTPAQPNESEEIEIEVKFIEFKQDVDFQKETWSRAPKVKILPECFYLIAYMDGEQVIERRGNTIPFPLIVGPDPKMAEEELVDIPGTDIKITKDMRWMVDFDEAVEKGMGFKIQLTPGQAEQGFDKLFVLGVKMSSTRSEGKENFETLIKHHYFGNSGFSFLPVGTPTNNTVNSTSGYNEENDADESYDLIFNSNGEDAEDNSEDNNEKFWWERTDREWFCKMLGISESTFDNTINTNGRDQIEARAMNTALWPATWGYYFDTMLKGAMNDAQLKSLRWYFNNFVVGRGTIPSIRIDDQPYGLLPTTAFSKNRWLNEKLFIRPNNLANEIPAGFQRFLPRLNSKFNIMQSDWMRMLEKVSHVGKDDEDPHQAMLNILGLHGGSVEFYNRIGESLEHIYNLIKIAQQQQTITSKFFAKKAGKSAVDKAVEDFIDALGNLHGGRELLEEFGYTGEEEPEILEKLFVLAAEKLVGPLIDDQPLSEENPIRVYSKNPTDNSDENYLQWLVRVAEDSFDKLRKEEGFIDNMRPNALLYLMLKYALEQSFFLTTLNLYQHSELLNAELLDVARTEPNFVHIRTVSPGLSDTRVNIKDNQQVTKPLDVPFASESRYNLLYQAQPEITGSDNLKVAEYIPQALKERHIATQYLYEQTKAINLLTESPTAHLERAFVEHIDLASYRFDAWKYGLVNYQLESLRDRAEDSGSDDEISVNEGLYIGAYGWLENVKSENKVLTPKKIPDDLTDIFNSNGNNPIYEDNKNLGYINAPSLNHAVTAAILRNGNEAYANEDNVNIFNINLSSERVRKALKMIEDIQNGQGLAALLGYEFERGIHDNNALSNVDHLIFKIRRKFPLAGNQIKSTLEEDESVAIDKIEARNVVDGLRLIDFVEKNLDDNGDPLYFDGIGIGDASQDEKNIVEAEINNIRDMNDAVADLAFAESVHQVAQGNIDRAAGTLDAYSSGNYPQIPDVVQTPRSGVNLTHRVGIQIRANVPFNLAHTPRAIAEPGLNLFLLGILPALSTIRCYTTFYHSASDSDVEDHPVSMSDLNLQPIDLLYMIDTNSDQSMKALDDCVVNYVLNSSFPATVGPDQPPRPDTEVKITYNKPTDDGNISIFETVSLIGHLKALLLRSRPLTASDVIGSDEANKSADSVQFLDRGRLDAVLDYINTRTFADLDGKSPKTFLDTYVTDMATSLEETGDSAETIISQIDDNLEKYLNLLKTLAPVGLPQTGTGFLTQWRKTQLGLLIKKVKDLIKVWDDKETEYNQLEGEYNALTDPAEKITKLLEMERVISTEITLEPGIDPVAFMNDVVSVKLAAFQNKRDVDFQDFIHANHATLSDTLALFDSVLSYEDFYLVETDTEDIRNACLSFANELLTKSELLQKDIDGRLSKINALLADYDGETDAGAQTKIIQEAGKILLGEEFKMIPSFSVPAIHMEEWELALNNVNSLLDYQINTKENPLPVDDWLYGVARVREKIGRMEQAIILIEGFKNIEIELTPVQFPRVEPYCWFATEFGNADEDLNKQLQTVFRENDHMLYTAYYHEPLNTGQNQCGLLIDEWTEIVPTEEETTGITFHYDRPNSEPPQTMLLALSPQLFGEGWSWQDLIDILHETLNEAKLRAVEPEQIEKDETTYNSIFKSTGYANLLPATISTVTKYPVSIMLNYAFNNQPITANIIADD